MHVYTDPGKHKVPFVLGNVNTETPLSEFCFGGAMRVGPTVIVSFRSLKPAKWPFQTQFYWKILLYQSIGRQLEINIV